MPISLKKNPSNKGRLEKKDRNPPTPPGPECVAVVLVEGTLLGPVIIKGQIIILIQVTFPIIHFRSLPTGCIKNTQLYSWDTLLDKILQLVTNAELCFCTQSVLTSKFH